MTAPAYPVQPAELASAGRSLAAAAPSRTTWAEDHVGVYSLAAIGRTAPSGLCGEVGSAFWVEEWGYPDIGAYIPAARRPVTT